MGACGTSLSSEPHECCPRGGGTAGGGESGVGPSAGRETSLPNKLALPGHDPCCWRELGPTPKSISALFWVKA